MEAALRAEVVEEADREEETVVGAAREEVAVAEAERAQAAVGVAGVAVVEEADLVQGPVVQKPGAEWGVEMGTQTRVLTLASTVTILSPTPRISLHLSNFKRYSGH